MPRRLATTTEGRLGLGITALAIAVACALYALGDQGLWWDASNYYHLAARFIRTGLFGFFDTTRTYGYPLFVGASFLVAGENSDRVMAVVFALQLAIYLATCAYAAARLADVFQSARLGLAIYVVTALNPVLLGYSMVLLTDSISASLLYLALVMLLVDRNAEERRSRVGTAALAVFLTALAVMVRPANLGVLAAVLGLWLARAFWRRDLPLKGLPVIALAILLPFVPQVYVNVQVAGAFSVMPARSIYTEQLNWGLHNVKYGTIVMDRKGTVPEGMVWQDASIPRTARIAADGRSWDDSEEAQLFYTNPLVPTSVRTWSGLLFQNPLAFVLSLALHGFGMLDQDYAVPYVRDYAAGYRWPLAVGNFAFLVLAVGGTALGLGAGWRLPVRLAVRPASAGDQPAGPERDRPASREFNVFISLERPPPDKRERPPPALYWALVVSAVMSLAYVAVYLPTAVEARFGLPLYLLLAPGFGFALVWLTRLYRTAQWRRLATSAGVAGVILLGCLAVAGWMWEQGPGPRARAREQRAAAQLEQRQTAPPPVVTPASPR